MKALIGSPISGVVLLVIQAQFLDEGSMKEIFSVVGVFLFLFPLMFIVAWFFCRATIDIFRREMRWVPIDGKINKVHVTDHKSSEGTHKSYIWSVEYMLFGSIKEKIFSSSHDVLSGYLKGKHDGDKIQLYINPDNLKDIEHKRGLLHKIVLVCVSVFFSTILGLFLFMMLEELIKKIK
jgi:uncharacterized membrane protein